MHSFSVVLNLLLTSAAIAIPHGEVFRRASCGEGAQSALSCIQSAGSSSAASFCASYIATKSTTIIFKDPVTTTISTTSTVGSTTVTAAISTVVSTTTVSGSATSTATDATSYTATISTTTTVATSTSTVTSTSTSYTCGSAVTTPVVKRQANAGPATCTASFASQQISRACNNCGAGFSTSTTTFTVTSVPTKVKTTIIKTTNTVIVTPTTTSVTTVFTTSTAVQDVALITDTTTTISTTATAVTTITTTTITASPTPTAFNLYYVAAASTHYAVQTPSPGGSGTMVGFNTVAADASVYHLDSSNALADTTGTELATNTEDEYPYLFDDVKGQTPATCSACNGVVTCTSGTQTGGDQFAVCDGFLALGTTFGVDGNGNTDCTLVTLHFATAPAAAAT